MSLWPNDPFLKEDTEESWAKDVARILCESGKFETGQGTCAAVCMQVLGDARKHPCPYRDEVHKDLAEKIARELFSK